LGPWKFPGKKRSPKIGKPLRWSETFGKGGDPYPEKFGGKTDPPLGKGLWFHKVETPFKRGLPWGKNFGIGKEYVPRGYIFWERKGF